MEGRGTLRLRRDADRASPAISAPTRTGPTGRPGSIAASTDPAAAELDGKALPAGFGVAVNPSTFENVATQVALGGKARVALTAWRNIPATTPEWERDFLVVEEHLPAGTTLIEGSVETQASSLHAGRRRAHLLLPARPEPRRDPLRCLRLPARPVPRPAGRGQERLRAGPVPPGPARRASRCSPRASRTPTPTSRRPTSSTPAARPISTPAASPRPAAALEPLFAGYTLRDDVAKDAARMLLLISIKDYEPRKVVQYFEVVKEKAPELILSFDQLLVDRPGLSRHQRIRAGDHRLARADRGQLPRGRAGRRAAPPARQDAGGHRPT